MNNNLIDMFSHNVSLTPAKPALVCNDEILSYQELQDLALKGITCLRNNLVHAGQKLGIILPNCKEFVAAMIAAADMGIVLVPECPSLPIAKILSTFKSADVDHVLCWPELVNEIRESIAQDETDFHLISITEFTQSIPFSNFNNAKDSYLNDFIITLTSGSTGSPKPIVLKQMTKLNRISAAANLYALNSDDIILAATPLYHSLAQRLVLMPLVLGGTSVLLAGYNISQWLKHVSKYNVTFTIAVSSQLKQLLTVDTTEYDLSSLKCIVSSSELLPTEYKKPLLELLSCDFHECYGASEIGIATNIAFSESQEMVGSVGRAIPDVKIDIIDENDNLCAPDIIGEICCKTPMAFTGYYNLPDVTANSYFNKYFRTGDLGYLNKDGFLFFSGRKKEMMISGGINIYPKDIEDTLISHDSVIQACVIAKEDAALGEVPVAVVVLDSQDISKRELLRFSAQNLAAHQIPRDIIFVEELARNDVGKIQKSLVAQQVNLNTSKN